MKRIVAWVLAGSWIVSAGCGGSHPPARPKRPGAATRPASVPATRPAETQPAATKPTTPQVAKDFDTELAKVRALVERTEFFEAMKACRDLRMAFLEHRRAGDLASLARRLKEYRRRAPAMANAVKGLLSDSLEVRRVASATLAQAGELGGIYLRKALRDGPADAIGPTAELLARAKDPNTPAILLAKLRADAADKVRAAAMPPLTRLIDQTAAGEFRRAHALALSASGAAQLDWLDYFLAVLDRRCGGTGAKLDELLAMGGAYEKLQAAAKVAWESSDPALVARASRHAGAFGLAVGRGHCLLWLRADRGVELNAAGRVVRWRDQSPRKGHAVQTAETQWPRIETVGERRFVKFDGLNDHLVLPKGFADFSKGVTMALWARPSGSKKWGRFLDLGNGSGVDNIVLSRSEATGDLAFQVYLGAQAGKVIAAKAIEQGTWHHYVATQDETGQVVLYRDAKQVATQKIPPAGKPVVKKLNYIARSNWPNDEYYGGLMDDLRVFDRALSAAEVRMIFQRTQQRYMVN